MREMLEPIFGESGAVVAQFIITLVLVLILLGLVYWIVQRFRGLRFSGVSRGRLPRLAIVDALSVDGRRKLVLVRRDNVEHLILIGGTSDVVVEPTIIRGVSAAARQRQAPGQAQAPRPQPQASAVPAAAPAPTPPAAAPQPAVQPAQATAAPQRGIEASGISEPIPFPPAQRPQPRARQAEPRPAEAELPRRMAPEPVPQRRAATRPAPAPAESAPVTAVGNGRTSSASAHFEEPTRPTRIESVFSLAETLDEIENEPVAQANAAEFAAARPRPTPSTKFAEERSTATAEAGEAAEALELSAEPAPATATADTTGDGTQENDVARAAKVSDLEREMARLLGEITSKRES